MATADLDPTTWSHPVVMGGVGGRQTYRREPANFAFWTGQREWGEVIAGQILIGGLASQNTPALLGWDVLREFRLEVVGGRSVTLSRL